MASKRVTELRLAQGFYEKSLSRSISSPDLESLRHCLAWRCARAASLATEAPEVQRAEK